jgi:hypothetical protein
VGHLTQSADKPTASELPNETGSKITKSFAALFGPDQRIKGTSCCVISIDSLFMELAQATAADASERVPTPVVCLAKKKVELSQDPTTPKKEKKRNRNSNLNCPSLISAQFSLLHYFTVMVSFSSALPPLLPSTITHHPPFPVAFETTTSFPKKKKKKRKKKHLSKKN